MNGQIILLLIAIIGVLVVISIIIGIVNIVKINSILEYSDEGDLISNLDKYYNNIRELQKKIKISQPGALSERLSAAESKINLSYSKTGIINFDAFDDIRGQQSFSLAVLNQYNDGYIITSLYGKSSSNTYIREIKEGKSNIKLLDEEQAALSKAMSANI